MPTLEEIASGTQLLFPFMHQVNFDCYMRRQIAFIDNMMALNNQSTPTEQRYRTRSDFFKGYYLPEKMDKVYRDLWREHYFSENQQILDDH